MKKSNGILRNATKEILQETKQYFQEIFCIKQRSENKESSSSNETKYSTKEWRNNFRIDKIHRCDYIDTSKEMLRREE